MQNEKRSQEWQKENGGEHFSKTFQKNEGANEPSENKHEKKAIQNFRDLKIWQLGKEIVAKTYKITRALPNEELYGLTTQMRRAAISIPCNISEGHSRRATRDYQRHLKIAAGSCAELETQVEVAIELHYFKMSDCEDLMEKIAYETCMVRKLIGKLSENRIHPPSSEKP